MKRCPECRRDYFDDSLLFCLDDGAPLLEGPASTEPPTVILPFPSSAGEAPTAIMSSIELSAEEPADSIAVLPFAHLSNDPDDEYFCDGLAEELLNALAKIEDLKVAARTSAFSFKGKDLSVGEIGRALGVKTVLEGSVRKFGGRIRVTVQLINASDGYQIWSERYDSEIGNVFELQDDIAQHISNKLRISLTNEQRQRLVKRYTANSEAHTLYLKGRFFVTTKRTEQWIKKGIECFQQAIEIDPTYALAYAGLADAYGFLASSTGGWKPADAYPKAKAAAERALEMDDTMSEAHSSLGFYYLLYEWDMEKAESEFRRAVELNPKNSNAHDGYGFYLKAAGRQEEAIEEGRKALELDPLSPFGHISLGWAYYFAGQYENARIECGKALELEPRSTFAHRVIGLALLQQEQNDEAIQSLAKAAGVSPTGSGYEAYLGYAYAVAGRQEEAKQILIDLTELSELQYVSPYLFAIVHIGLGMLDEAYRWFDRAVVERSGFMAYIDVEPMLNRLRPDERFKKLGEKIAAARGLS